MNEPSLRQKIQTLIDDMQIFIDENTAELPALREATDEDSIREYWFTEGLQEAFTTLRDDLMEVLGD